MVICKCCRVLSQADPGVPEHERLQARTATGWGQGLLSEILSLLIGKAPSSVPWLGLVKGSHFVKVNLLI